MSKSGQRRACARSRQKQPMPHARRCLDDPTRPCPKWELRCRAGDLAVVTNITGGGWNPYPSGMLARVDFTPLLGRIVRVVRLDTSYAPCVPVWWLEEEIILPDVYGRPCTVASLPDARLRPLRGFDMAADSQESDVLPVQAETGGVGCRS